MSMTDREGHNDIVVELEAQRNAALTRCTDLAKQIGELRRAIVVVRSDKYDAERSLGEARQEIANLRLGLVDAADEVAE